TPVPFAQAPTTTLRGSAGAIMRRERPRRRPNWTLAAVMGCGAALGVVLAFVVLGGRHRHAASTESPAAETTKKMDKIEMQADLAERPAEKKPAEAPAVKAEPKPAETPVVKAEPKPPEPKPDPSPAQAKTEPKPAKPKAVKTEAKPSKPDKPKHHHHRVT